MFPKRCLREYAAASRWRRCPFELYCAYKRPGGRLSLATFVWISSALALLYLHAANKYMNRFIVVTGAAGFIGSDLVGYLNGKGYTDLILVDEFGDPAKEPNLAGKAFSEKVEREVFWDWLKENRPAVSFVFHIGARTDTTEFDYSVHERLNVEY